MDDQKEEHLASASLQRTEEVQHIIERMPTRFGKIIGTLVIFIVVLLLLFGWLIRYPDVVTGEITINAEQAPLKLVAIQSGKLQLSDLRSQDSVKEGQLIAWFENPATLSDVFYLSRIIDSLQLPVDDAKQLYERLPRELILGELTSKYFAFLNALKQLADYQSNHLYQKQRMALEKLLQHQQQVLSASANKANISKENLELIKRFSDRDSILLSAKVLSPAEMDRTKLNNVSAKDQYQTTIRDVADSRVEISRTESQLQELAIQQTEKQQQLNLDLLTTYNDLRDNLINWEQRYVFKAPFDGKVQFLGFWNNNQFVQTGKDVFAIIPTQQEIEGQAIVPAVGAGKIKLQQEAVVKLNDYPFREYGSLTGSVKEISLITNATQSPEGEVESYLISISFPRQLETNYHSQLDFRYEMKGTVEIIVQDRRLIERFFDNLKYIANR
ncbi:MAG: HlyD family secretion protein [Olivibacter sp.]|nr:HlyD family secretion protein [Olivibacter sp. UJ_SKK_5.1]